jgi:hypothetical protein
VSGQELKELLNEISVDGSLKDKILKDRAEYSPENKHIGIHYKTARHFTPARFIRLKEHLDAHKKSGIRLFLSQNDFTGEMISDCGLLEKHCKDFCILKQPILAPFISSANIGLIRRS